MSTTDHGPHPFVTNIKELAITNDKFRVASWTGNHLQMTVMALKPGEEVGLEVHEDHDQFLRIEAGDATVEMGPDRNHLDKIWEATENDAIFVPAGTWHNITCSGDGPLKLYSIYAPGEHPAGTVHETYQDAQAAEADASHA